MPGMKFRCLLNVFNMILSLESLTGQVEVFPVTKIIFTKLKGVSKFSHFLVIFQVFDRFLLICSFETAFDQSCSC